MIFNRSKKLKIVSSLVIVLAIALMPLVGIGDSPAQAAEPGQLAPINPDFTEFWENPPDPFYGYIPPPMDLSHLDEIPVERARGFATFPSSFDWRDTGKVTSVKDQNPCGTCWVFGTTSVLESAVLIGEDTEYNFSEQSVALCVDRSWVYLYDDPDDPCNAGGNSFRASEVFIKKGAVLESCNHYDTDGLKCDGTCVCDDCPPIKKVNGYRYVTGDQSQTTLIKEAISDHGPVTMLFYYDDSHKYTDATYGTVYDCAACTDVNHLVSIIGWNDSIPHFETPGTGAWLVKNSWGTGWGNAGYFWLAYDSSCMREIAYLEYEDYDSDEQIYYWDEAGTVGALGNWDDYSGWMANIFSSGQNGNLTHVDFWTTSSNAQYQIYVYLDGNISDGLQNLATSQSGSCQEFGYYSIALTSPVSLTNGQSFIIAVRVTTTGYKYPLPAEYQYAEGGTTVVDPPIQSGKSFYRHGDSDSWTDAADQECNLCLRARVTTVAAGQPDITVSPTSFEETLAPDTTQDYTLNIGNAGNATLTYTITDEDTTAPTAPAGVEALGLPSGPVREREGLIQLSPSQPVSFPTLPTTGTEIAYDDGEAECAWVWDYACGRDAVRFTPLSYPVTLDTARICLWPEWPDGDHEEFGVEVYDDDGPGGSPGTLLGSVTATATDWGWCDVDISGLGITITEGDFYVASHQLTDGPDCEGLCADETDPDGRSWSGYGGDWWPVEADETVGLDWMIRCVVQAGEGNNPPYTPSNPSPANHATGVSINADLSWTGGDPDPGDTVTYDVYLDTTDATTQVSNDQSACSYDPGTLNNNTKYYWKIVATDNHTASTTGPLWDFTTGGAAEDCPWLSENPTSGSVEPGNSDSITVTISTTGLTEGDYSANIIIANNDPDENPKIVPVILHVNNAPNTPSNPSPANHAANVSAETDLSWTGGDPDVGDTVTYDVYFGTNSSPPFKETIGPYTANETSLSYGLDTLAYNTTYYWQIIATDTHEVSTAGPVWDFTTEAEAAAFDPWVYDINDDDAIQKTEALAAVVDYFDLEITKAEALEVIALYFG